MEKLLVYPFNREFTPIVKNCYFLNNNNLDIVNLVTMAGWGLEGDAYECINSKIIVRIDYMSALNECDTVWIIDSWLTLSFEEYIYPNVKAAVLNNKNILITRELTRLEKLKIEELNCNKNISYLDVIKPRISGRIVEVKTPIVAIAGVSQNTNKFELELSLKHEFEEKGYHVLLIASRKEANVIGDYSIPEFMLTNELSENNKILAFNHFVTQLESEKQPDIIILGIPGSVVSYDNKFFKDFGVLAFEISRSVSIDSFILCSLFADYEKEYFQKCEQVIGEQLGVSIDFHALSKFTIDESEMIEREKVFYLTLDEDIVDTKVKEINYPRLINPFKKQNVKLIMEILVESLTTNISIETV